MHNLLRLVLLTDGVILTLLGTGLLLAPSRMLALFGYREVPHSMDFVVSMWGAALLSVAMMHWAAQRRETLRDWAQLGFWRNLLEFGVTLGFVLNGVVNLRQSWPGLFIPIWFAIFYFLVPRLVEAEAAEAAGAPGEVQHVG
jgi:hypothetical protein